MKLRGLYIYICLQSLRTYALKLQVLKTKHCSNEYLLQFVFEYRQSVNIYSFIGMYILCIPFSANDEITTMQIHRY